LYWPDNLAVKIIRSFVEGTDKYGNWDDLMSIPHTNPAVIAAVELINEFDRRFPARHNREYCAPDADPYFLAIADLLEQDRIHVKDKAELEFINGEYSPKMKELIECVENMVSKKSARG
jgi:hypothetical protein